jgi:hypothetical protein
MSFTNPDWLGQVARFLRSAEMPAVTELRFDSQAPVPTDAFVGASIAQDAQYFGVTLNQLWLAKGREWWSTYDPLVHVNVDFLYGTAPVSVSRLIGPSILRGKLAGGNESVPHGFLQSDILAVGPHPFRGGAVEVTVILYKVRRTEYAKRLIALAENLSTSFGVGPAMMPYLKMGGALVDAVDATFQMGDSVPVLGHQVGLNTALRPLRTQYLALVAGALGAPADARVADGKLSLPGGAESSTDHVLYSVFAQDRAPPEATAAQAPTIRAMEESVVHGGDTGWDRARSMLLAMYLDLRNSPDLLRADADRVLEDCKKSLQELRALQPGLMGETPAPAAARRAKAARELDDVTKQILAL